MKCSCPNQQQGQFNRNVPPRPATCQDIPSPYGAIAWDDGDCVLDDWSSPVALRPGEERQWYLIQIYSIVSMEIKFFDFLFFHVFMS